MNEHEISAIVFLLGYAALLGIAIKVFGVRRVLWAIVLVVFVAVAVAFKTLAGISGGRR